MERKIDYVLSYIDYSQEEIRELYKQTNGEEYAAHTNNTYISIDLVIRSIMKNMPFIDRVFIVCKDLQKLPMELETLIEEANGRIIRINESMIMPNCYVTFSSACIEMFIWRIPTLSEYFIYGNDDMIPIREMGEIHFYDEDGKPTIDAAYRRIYLNNLYQLHCLNATNLVFDRHKNDDDYNRFYNVAHTMRPLRRSICDECYMQYYRFILGSLSHIRYFNNFNMDLYILYGMRHELIKNEPLKYRFDFIPVNQALILLSEISELIAECPEEAPHVICLNDGTSNEVVVRQAKRSLDNLLKKVIE